MKITKKQLRSIIREEKATLQREGFRGSVPRAMVNLSDVDTGRSVFAQVTAVPEAEMVTLRFGNSFTISLDTQSAQDLACLLYTSPSPRDRSRSRMPSSA